MSNLLSCQQIKLMLDAYHDGELSESERGETERHLTGCVSCQNDAAAIAIVAKSLKDLPTLTPKIDVAANIDQMIAARSQPTFSNVSRPVVWSAVGIAAAAAVVLFVGKFGAPVQTADVAVKPSAPAHEQQTALMPEKKQAPMIKSTKPITVEHDLPKPEIAVKPVLPSGKNDHAASQKPASLIAQRTGGVNGKGKDANSTNKQLSTTSSTTTIAVAPKQNDSNAVDKVNNSLIAVYDADQHNAVTEELGITTNEDGLYAIKL